MTGIDLFSAGDFIGNDNTEELVFQDAARGVYRKIVVQDNGSGMTPTQAEKIFNPFFTTKPVNKGTGLGLSISYSIIQKHNGELSVKSEPGKGTKFTVKLPLNLERQIKNA